MIFIFCQNEQRRHNLCRRCFCCGGLPADSLEGLSLVSTLSGLCAVCALCRGSDVMVEVSLAMVEKEGQWLLQLRDDLDWIVAPGCWGLFGGHLEPGESPEEALRRELLEEISWRAGTVHYRFAHRNAERVLHFFTATLLDPLDSLCLREGQDVVLASPEDLRKGSVWSPALRQFRPLAPSLQLALAHLWGSP